MQAKGLLYMAGRHRIGGPVDSNPVIRESEIRTRPRLWHVAFRAGAPRNGNRMPRRCMTVAARAIVCPGLLLQRRMGRVASDAAQAAFGFAEARARRQHQRLVPGV